MTGTLENHPDEAAATRTVSGAKVLLCRRIIFQAASMWLATRLVFVVFTYFAFIFLLQGFDPDFMGKGGVSPPGMLLQSWNRWDTGWYLKIAAEGYEVDPLRTAFFPLYPLLIYVFTLVMPFVKPLAIALAISNLGTLIAFVTIGLLAAQEDGEAAAPYAIGALAAYPLAFFLAAAYSDGLFLGLAALSILFARRSAWYWAALCAFLAALTRPAGVVLILPLFWEYASQHGWLSNRWRDGLRVGVLARGALVLGSVPLAIGLYAFYLWNTFGNPLIFVQVQSFWKHELVPLWDVPFLVWNAVTREPMWSFNQARIVVDVLPTFIFTIITLVSIRRMPASFTLYAVGVLIFSLANPLVSYFDPLASVSRYLIASFPVFLMIGRWSMRYPWLHIAIMSGGFMLQGIFTGFFLMGGWMV